MLLLPPLIPFHTFLQHTCATFLPPSPISLQPFSGPTVVTLPFVSIGYPWAPLQALSESSFLLMACCVCHLHFACCFSHFLTLKMEAVWSSETS
jgi:hypothetical protein